MKIPSLVFAVMLVLSVTVVCPVSAAWPFDDLIDAVNESIIPWLDAFISTFTGIIIAIILFVLYPFILLIYLAYEIISQVYYQAASVINIFLGIPNIISALLTAWLPGEFPTVWTLLFLMSIGLTAFARVMRLLQYLKSWIPVLFG